MSKIKNAVIAILVLALLCCSFVACTPAGQEEGIAVSVRIMDPNNEIFLGTGADFKVPEGTTVDQAVIMLCQEREATYTQSTSGGFLSFTYSDVTIEETQGEANDDGTVPMTYLTWSYNGTDMSNSKTGMAETVLNDGDAIIISFVTENVKPDN